MEAAKKIREAVAEVSRLREACDTDPDLHAASVRVKRLQAQRFAGTYADLLSGGPSAAAARFFLEELYSDKDFSERDAQFARIAGAIEKLFPHQVVDTAVALAQLHGLTEELDHGMALAWRGAPAASEALRYASAWREVGRRTDRERQLTTVLGIGDEMARLTRTPGLRMMLRMMRGPAAAAGLGSLQHFLESGFDTFGDLARRRGAVEEFLDIIEAREKSLIVSLFDADLVTCETELARTLGQAR